MSMHRPNDLTLASLECSSSAEDPSWERSAAHQRRAHRLIPGGAHTYAKGDDQYPEAMAPVIRRGSGCRVWDIDGNEYLEFGAGVRSVTLGHAYAPVCRAAQEALWAGVNFARPAEIELRAAEVLLSCLPSAEMVKFAKNGSDATTAAVKLARAITNRPLVGVCSDQPFFSIDDWFIALTETNAGIPQAVRELTVSFPFNDLPAVEALFEAHGGELACLLLEGERDEPPEPGYLAGLRQLCDRHGVLLILDETITGFRLHSGGAQTLHNVEPDLSTFGKGIANGFSVSALAGKRCHMERGGLTTRDERVFLLSTTHGGETHALAAAIATMREIRRHHVCDYLAQAGTRLRDRLNELARAEGIFEQFHVVGHPANLIYVTKDADGRRSQAFRTLFLQETLRRGILAPNLVVNFSHGEDELERAIDRIAEVLTIYRDALEDGVEHYLAGRPVKPVFRRFN